MIKKILNLKLNLNSYNFGIGAELITILYFLIQGYRILKYRYKTKVGEIDIIIMKQNLIIFVEVKARNKMDHLELITMHQQKRIIRTANLFLSLNPRYTSCDLRFDLVHLTKDFKFKHIKNIFMV